MPTGENVRHFHGALLLNETGAIIYEQLQQGKSIEDIANKLMTEFDVFLTKALEDVKKTIGALQEAGVVDEN